MIRVGPGTPPPVEEPMPPEAPPQEPMAEEPPAKTLYSADKAQIMEAMNLIHQALMLLLEVCPPDEYEDEGMPMEENMPMEEEEPVGPPEA
jgi:hypothetical protein